MEARSGTGEGKEGEPGSAAAWTQGATALAEGAGGHRGAGKQLLRGVEAATMAGAG